VVQHTLKQLYRSQTETFSRLRWHSTERKQWKKCYQYKYILCLPSL